MTRLPAAIVKELLLLSRDRAGLLVLFLMPAVLVIVVSLVQENILKVTGETAIRVLFVDHDRQLLAEVIESQLRRSGNFAIEKEVGGRPVDEESARAAVQDGEFQFAVVIPAGATVAVQSRVKRQITTAFGPGDGVDGEDSGMTHVTIFFDPLVQGTFRASVTNALYRILLTLELELKAQAVSEIMAQQVSPILPNSPDPRGAPLLGPALPQPTPEWGRRRVMEIDARQAASGNTVKLPSSVQQNVPAWALFGMFFIVVPMGGALIREKQEGTLLRQMSLPVSYLTILAGKVCAYVLVGCIQFALILVVGKFVLPLLGAPVLEIGSAPLAIAVVVIAAALAAAGCGILLGTLARTYEQASMFGAVSVVIAAAVGGIMVPVYAMPQPMQQISRFSPLAWGLNALVDVFARNGSLRSVLPQAALLLVFFAGTVLLSRLIFGRRGPTGR
ncbi:MAG: ABC transporter permease [Desulfobacterales bacterium]